MYFYYRAVFIIAVQMASVFAFDCASEGYSFDQEGDRYSINTCRPCVNGNEPAMPICHLRPLLQQLNHSKIIIQRAKRQLDVTAPSFSVLCNPGHFNSQEYPGGVSLVDTLKDSYQLMTGVALRMAMINNYPTRHVSVNILPIRHVLCKMKGLLRFVDVPESVYTTHHREELNSRSHRILFACKNLRRAITIINHVENIIRSDVNNSTVPTFARIENDFV